MSETDIIGVTLPVNVIVARHGVGLADLVAGLAKAGA
jgi:hypothetical protein